MGMSIQRWDEARRVEAWAGETRVNLLRALALTVFYLNHLFNAYLLDDPTVTPRYNAAVTAIVLAWGVVVLGVWLCLSRRWVPPALKYVATALDLTLITFLLIASPDGPRSALIFLYFVAIAASPLRLSLPLVYFTTFGVWLAGLALMGYHVFYRVGWDIYYAKVSPERIPRVSQILFLLATGAAGVFAGQVVRQARRLVEGYPVMIEDEAPDAGGPEEGV
jgi:hypothetical protein